MKIKITAEHLKQLAEAQQAHTIHMLTTHAVDGYSDDGHDDITGALELLSLMLGFIFDRDIAGFEALLNGPRRKRKRR